MASCTCWLLVGLAKYNTDRHRLTEDEVAEGRPRLTDELAEESWCDCCGTECDPEKDGGVGEDADNAGCDYR
jgi:hypothetical protein